MEMAFLKVDTLGTPRVISGDLDYDDNTLFDGKPVITEYRRQGNEEFKRVSTRYPNTVDHPEYLRQDMTQQDYGPKDNKSLEEYSSEEEQEEHELIRKDETEPPTGITEAVDSYSNTIVDDYMGIRDKQIITKMINQIYSETDKKVHEVNLIIEMYTAALGFEIGKVIGLIQARYRHQMELWREVSNKEIRFGYPPRTRQWPAAWTTVWIEMLLSIPRADMQLPALTIKSSVLTPKDRKVTLPRFFKNTPEQYTEATTGTKRGRISKKQTSKKPSGLRAKDSPKWAPGGSVLRRGFNFEEEKLKHRMREQYLLRKLGQNASGHTLKPRFRLGWPVEDTWDNIPLY